MANFPTLSSGAVTKYPVTRRKKFRTAVYTHVDMSEQRFSKGGAPLVEFDLSFNSVTTEDKELVRDFFNNRRGSFDTTWDLTLEDKYVRAQDTAAASGERTVFEHLQFMPNQRFEATENKPGRWSFTLKVRQTRRDA